MSADLIWSLTRKTSSFLVKRDGVQFSTEPLNVAGVHSFKNSGLANNKAVGVSLSKDGKSVQLSVKKTGAAARKPKDSLQVVSLKNRSGRGAAHAIKKLTASSFYRGDLSHVAAARYHALHKSIGIKPTIAKKESRRKRNKKTA